MKPLDTPKKVVDVEEEVPETIDFSKVEIEPLFADFVDFETFSKSDFIAVKVKDCKAVEKSKNFFSLFLMTVQVPIVLY